MIVVENLTKQYGARVAVDNVNFRIAKGEIVGFLGPNGAGKSTTMRMLTGFLSPTNGSVTIGDFDMAENPLEAKSLLGYLPETPPLYPEMTVRDYLNFVGQLKGLSQAALKERLAVVLEKCFLTDRTHQLIGQLSKGYKQRVGIAQALIHNPPVLILDEPTSGLDPQQIIQIRALIKELAVDHTIILSTHILPEVQTTCSRVLIINGGRLVAEGSAEQLEAQLQGGMRISLVVRGPQEGLQSRLLEFKPLRDTSISVVENLPGVIQAEVNLPAGLDLREDLARMVVNSGWGLIELKSINLSLEEIFLKLTTREPIADAAGKEATHV
ncbi:MAG: ATP-binding cassette domain-containing protein [Candidatus Sericytochromatia bacterium]|nr:ATP-binding cassette domain-containing protein [Candidatus Sericytochromatia bacterium]